MDSGSPSACLRKFLFRYGHCLEVIPGSPLVELVSLLPFPPASQLPETPLSSPVFFYCSKLAVTAYTVE